MIRSHLADRTTRIGLDDLCVRFIINLPEADLSSVERICFQVEEAQWFYEDFIRPLDPSLPSMSLRSFCLRIFQHCPLLSAFSIDNHMQAFEEFLLYKNRVPVRGAIMLNHAMDSVVLVKGWKKGANWSFPRGKINKNEDDLDCAVREVYEETGFDIRLAGLVPQPDEVKYIDIPMREQHIRLYVFRDVPMDTHFEPKTRKEISKIEWYRLSDLPAFRKKNGQAGNDVEAARNANKFYMVAPFLVPLKKWVQQQKKKDSEQAILSQHMLPQYVEEAQTEEEGFRSTAEGVDRPMQRAHVPSIPGLDTLEGATAALQRLLKIQPPTQGLQEATTATQSPVGKNTGDALLAILRGKTQAEMYQTPPKVPQTPMELTLNSAPIPRNPHHQYTTRPQNVSEPVPQHYNGLRNDSEGIRTEQPRQGYQFPQQPFAHPASNNMPFPISDPQEAARRRVDLRRDYTILHPAAGYTTADNVRLPNMPFQGPSPQQPPHANQPQFLQHPQPLPPPVQQGVFSGGQVHGPVLPSQFMQQTGPQQMPHPVQQRPQPFPQPSQNSGFQSVHGPAIPRVHKYSPSQLTSHSLTLLNAFRSQDRAVPGVSVSGEHPLARFAHEHVTPTMQIQELSSEQYPQQQANRAGAQIPPAAPSPPVIHNVAVKPPPTDAHKSSLLNLFKSPAAATVSLAKAVSPEPTTNAPPAAPYPQHKVSPAPRMSSRGPLPDGTLELSKPKIDGRAELQSRAPEANQPFRPTAILTRPAQPISKPATTQTPHPAGRGKVLASTSTSLKRRDVRDVKKQQIPAASPQVTKPFAPQILKRPAQGHPAMPAELSAASPTMISSPVLPTIHGRDAAHPSPQEHKQALLSLFKKMPETGSPRAFEQPKVVVDRQFALGGENIAAPLPPRRSSTQTPISSTDKGFLLGYLDTIAKGGL